MMKAKEIVHKNKVATNWQKMAPLVGVGVIGVVFIFMVIWYFKYAGVLAEKQLHCVEPDTAGKFVKEVLEQTGMIVSEEEKAVQPALKSPFIDPGGGG